MTLRRDLSLPNSELIPEHIYKFRALLDMPVRCLSDVDSLGDLKDNCDYWVSHPAKKGEKRRRGEVEQEDEDEQEGEEEGDKENK